MVNHFIAVQSFLHQIDCFCPDKQHSDFVKINQTDIIRILNERTYNEVNGWYVLVEINYDCFYIAVEDLDHYNSQGLLYSELDLELQLNYLNFHIDESLDQADEGKFKEVSSRWLELKMLNEKLGTAVKSIQFSL
jgi:hypothetical protein